MSIAEKLVTIAENQQKVYDAGYEAGKISGGGTEFIKYVTTLNGLFQQAVFPSGTEIELNINHMINCISNALFLDATGLSSISLNIVEVANDDGMLFTNAFNSNTTCTKITLLGYATNVANITQCFNKCDILEEIIGELDFTKCTSTLYAFNGSPNLKRIQIKPLTLSVGISFSKQSLLDDDSIQSIIDGLADLTDSDAQTITFHADVEARMTDEQKATITSKNWTLAVA